MDWRNRIDEEERIEGIRLSHLPQAGRIMRMGDRYISYWPDGNRSHVRIVDGQPEELVCSCHDDPEMICRHEAALCMQLERLHLIEPPMQENRSSRPLRNSMQSEPLHQPAWQPESARSSIQTDSRSACTPQVTADEKQDDSAFIQSRNRNRQAEDFYRDLMKELFGIQDEEPHSSKNPSALQHEEAPQMKQSDHPHVCRETFDGHFGRDETPERNPEPSPKPSQKVSAGLQSKTSDAAPIHMGHPSSLNPKLQAAAEEENDHYDPGDSYAKEEDGIPKQKSNLYHFAKHGDADSFNAIDDENDADGEDSSADNKQDVFSFHDFLETFDKDELIEQIETYAFRHPDLKDTMISAKAKDYPDDILSYLEFEAERRLSAFLGSSAHSGVRAGRTAAHEFCTWLSMQTDALSRVHEDQYAIDLLESVLVSLEGFASVRNESAVREIGSFIFEYMEQIASIADKESIEDLHAWIELALESSLLPDFEMDLIRLLERPLFELESLAVPRFRLLVRLFEKMQEEGRSARVLRPLLVSILRLESEWSLLEKEGESFERRYGHLAAVRLERAKVLRSQGADLQAAHLLETCRREHLSDSMEEEVLRELLAIYHRHGNVKKEESILRRLIFDLSRSDASDLERLAALEDEQTFGSDLKKLEEAGDSDLLIEYYDRAGKDEALLTIIESSGALHHLDEYEDRLKAVDEKRLAGLWLSKAKQMSGDLHDRQDYRLFARAISSARKAEENEESLQTLVSQVKEKNRRKKALLSELEKIGC